MFVTIALAREAAERLPIADTDDENRTLNLGQKQATQTEAASGVGLPATEDEAESAGKLCRFADLLRSAVDWYWETDEGLNLTLVSPGAAAVMGVPEQLLVGRNIFSLLHHDDGDRAAEQSLNLAVQEHRPFRVDCALSMELEGEPSTGWARLTGVPFYAEVTGQFAGYRGTGARLGPGGTRPEDPDTAGSLLGMLEAALARKDQLEWELSVEGDKAFQDRLASIAHELRTPLNAIIGFAEVIKDRHLGDDPERYRDYARNIHESGLHLLEIINGLLDLARIDAGHTEPAAEQSLDLKAIAGGVLRMLDDKAGEAGITLVDQIPDRLPRARGERRAVRQILINLLNNAIKYTPSGGTVGVEGREGEFPGVEIIVWDTGVGISAADQKHVFERSYRAADTGLDRPGSGLGLAISRDLAQAMQGDLTLTSKAGKGTRVVLRLPSTALDDGDDQNFS